MTRQIRWLRVIVEGIVIVGSILLAFGLQAWWEGRQEREEERALLASLLDEFEFNRQVLGETANNHRGSSNGLEGLLRLPPGRLSISGDSIARLFRAAQITPHYNASNGAMTATIGSGRIGLISNTALRDQLAGWDGVTSDLVLDEQTRRDFVVHQLRPAFATFGIPDGGEWVDQELADYDAALWSPEIRALLTSQVRRLQHLRTAHYEPVEEAMRDLIRDLRAELSAR